MTSPLSLKLEHAETALAVANTPEFLERKLRADPDVKELYLRFGSDELRRSLGRALRRKPKDLSDAVRPYALLVAMSFDQSRENLESAFSLKAKYHDLYEDFKRILRRRRTSTSFSSPSVNLKPVRFTFS